jgi:DNA-binding HxlR family transcriptional regulator
MAERWTPLVVRNLLLGAHTFNDLARGVPAMSRSMLAKRLTELERAGVVRAAPKLTGRGSSYELTAAGADLATVIHALGEWGERWVEVTSVHADPGFALWAWCQAQLDRSKLPPDRVVVAFVFPDQPARNRYYWLLVEHGDAEVCYADPGGEPDLFVEAESGTFVDWHRGALSWPAAQRTGRITVSGPPRLARSLPSWNLHTPSAPRTRESS